ncbi:MAG TPA: cytidine deaminase [Polyangiaceae bacterium]|jgi:cytidine deaminase|nr:cytidine deaminase [Polyangiaceae bacterium]
MTATAPRKAAAPAAQGQGRAGSGASRGGRGDHDADLDRLVEQAIAVRAQAYAPYSKYKVGAALLTRSGAIYAGCNVENATYGATLCAERSAIAAMVAAGDSAPVACAVVTAGPEPGAPCGICRQVLAEFAREMELVLVAQNARGRVTARVSDQLSALLPRAFRLR